MEVWPITILARENDCIFNNILASLTLHLLTIALCYFAECLPEVAAVVVVGAIPWCITRL